MKPFLILSLLFILSSLSGPAATPEISALITVTNSANITNSATITVNGVARLWTNNPAASPATQIQTTNSIPYATTNLLRSYQIYAAAGPIRAQTNGNGGASNAFLLVAQPSQSLTVTFSPTNYAYVTYSTNYYTNAVTVRMPFTSEPIATRTNVTSELVSALGTYPSNTFAQTAPLLTGYANVGQAQGVTNKAIYSSTNIGGVVSNQWLRYARIANESTVGPQTNYGLAFSIWHTGAPAARIIADNIGYPSLVNPDGTSLDISADPDDRHILNFLSARNMFPNRLPFGSTYSNYWTTTNTHIGFQYFDGGFHATGIVAHTAALTNVTAAIASATATNLDVRAGTLTNVNLSAAAATVTNLDVKAGSLTNVNLSAASATVTNLVVPGTGSALVTNLSGEADTLYVTNLQARGGLLSGTVQSGTINTNTVYKGTNDNTGDWSDQIIDVTSLANGNNAGVIATGAVMRLSPGPTAAYNINGIAGGRNGRVIELWNNTIADLTLVHQSGVDPVAANRIFCPDGTNVVVRTNAAAVLRYDSTTSRWRIRSVWPWP